MSEMNLIPSDYQQQLQVRGWVRKSLLVYAVLIAVIVGGKVTLSLGISGENARIGTLRASKRVTLNQLAFIQNLHARKAEAEKRLEILAGLRGGPAAEEMFVTMDRALDRDVWFHTWSFRRAGEIVEVEPQTVGTGYFIVIPKSQKQDQDKAWRLQTHMEIKGQARNHSALANFVKRLVGQPEIEDVRVLNTTLRRYTRSQVVDFDLAVVVDSRPEEG
jgi:Tfp pilus assembly protein PilN